MSIGGVGGAGYAPSPYGSTQKSAAGGLGAASVGPANDAVSEFMSWAKMTPAQQMRAQILGSMGLKESDLAAMDPKQRDMTEKKIAERIKQLVQNSVEKKTGVAVDIKA
ncbi:hypothetical protein ACO2Q3_12985 [Caulobacter sp. KR2-114]|uniref:hypothetical protein n=1 Tax=Caulobacter sp. KR2-114 TaxID=3400912 RepID=UPI003C0D7EA0